MSLAAFVARLPKVELHVHLEGSMPPGTLLTLARRNGVHLPVSDEAGVREWFRFRDFDHFVTIYLACSACLKRPEDFRELALGFLAEQARQNIVYTEAHFTIGTHLANGGDGEAIREALESAAREGEERWGVRLALIPDIVRNMPENADATLDWVLASRPAAEALRPAQVVALGLSGTEATHGNGPFRDHFQEAERRGLHRVAHAGEHAGPGAIEAALDEARAERIGHGVRAIDSPRLVAELARRQVPLEVCPTSNLCLGVYPELLAHPFDRLRRAGVQVTVNSDDPPFFDTTLSDEYLRLATTFGYGPPELADLARAAVAASFLPAADKTRLGERIAEELARELGA